jgi:aspartyl-tRNA(Asn)/glutamyl-tRNA(Gln) amidotransferase subunit A
LLAGAFVSAGDLVQAQRLRRQLLDAVDQAFETCDVLMTANSMQPACRIDDPGEIARTYTRQARTPFNVTGHPAIVLMAGLSQGLPLSVQFAARYFDETMLFRVAATFERISGYASCHPPEPR